MSKKEKKEIKHKKSINNKIEKQQKKLAKKLKKKEKGSIIGRIFKVNNKFNLVALIKNILLPLGGGLLIGFLTRNSMVVYNSLKKPIFTPPSFVFPIVWTILYILMGISSYMVYIKKFENIDVSSALFVYEIQLLLNCLWSFLFFGLRLYGVSFIELVILFAFVVLTVVRFYKKAGKKSAILLVPYLIWLVYAGTLNFYIWMLNEM